MSAIKQNKDGSVHVHTWAARGAGTAKVNRESWVCMDPDCTTLTARELLIGKRSLCNLCREPMILSTVDLKRARPRCFACSKTDKAVQAQKVRNRLLEMGIE
jgi:hypothetical protein